MKQTRKTWLVLACLLITSLACSMFSSATPTKTLSPDTNSKIELVPTVDGYIGSSIYSTGIEITKVIEVPGLIDHNGKYALTFPQKWVLGALHTDFTSIVEKESQANENVKALFEYFLKTDPNIRAFGFSTLPTQLNKNSFVVAVVKTFKDDAYLSRSIDELADMFLASQASPELVKFTYRSKPLTSASNIPTLIMLNEVQDGNGNISIYNGILLAKLGSAYVQVFFLTNNPEINLANELAYPASSIMNYNSDVILKYLYHSDSGWQNSDQYARVREVGFEDNLVEIISTNGIWSYPRTYSNSSTFPTSTQSRNPTLEHRFTIVTKNDTIIDTPKGRAYVLVICRDGEKLKIPTEYLAPVDIKVKSDGTPLNVRNAPSVGSIVRTIPNGTSIVVYELRRVGNNIWLRIDKDKQEWVAGWITSFVDY